MMTSLMFSGIICGVRLTVATRPSSPSGDSIFNLRDCSARLSASQTNGSPSIFSASRIRKPPLARCSAPGRSWRYEVYSAPWSVLYSIRPNRLS
ncbi:hypothetical protein D3C81_2163270 [compost metagenome]